MLLAKRIKDLRIKRGLTQQDLGDLIDVTKVSICCYESGTRVPTLETLLALARALEVDINYLLGEDQNVIIPKVRMKPVRLAKEEVEFIHCLRKYEDVYQLAMENPCRAVELISKKLK